MLNVGLWRSGLSCLLAPLLVLSCCAVAALSSEAENQSLSGRVRLLLPPVIYTVPRIEANLYFDNVVLVLNRQLRLRSNL